MLKIVFFKYLQDSISQFKAMSPVIKNPEKMQ